MKRHAFVKDDHRQQLARIRNTLLRGGFAAALIATGCGDPTDTTNPLNQLALSGDQAAVINDNANTADVNAPGNQDAATRGNADMRPGPRTMDQRRRAERIGRPPSDRLPDPNAQPAQFPAEFRTIDGFGNNIANPEWGASGTAFVRTAFAAYEDGLSTPAGSDRPSAREVSNVVVSATESKPNPAGATDYLWQWGQFLDHDIDETPIADPAEPFPVAVPATDVLFDPAGTGTVTIGLNRSAFMTIEGVREQVNEITAYIDASNVYGSEHERAEALRTLDGTGRLRTSAGDLLPFNDVGLENAASNSDFFFLAGDIRANEQVGLTAMHTLFMREHNHWADQIATQNPDFTGDEIYEHARAIVAAEMQAITYREFLPLLLGPNAIPRYRGYQPGVNVGIANEFATAAYRVGHTMLSSELLRLDANGDEIAAGNLPLAQAFFNPLEIVNEDIDSILRGLAGQAAQSVDNEIVDAVRNFLFGAPGSGGFDLASLNIQRGRDHGLPTLNEMRVALGLAAYASFAEINADATVTDRLANVYSSVDDIDLWVGGLSETHVAGALVGETWYAILADQFTRLRDGDRFWYQGYLSNDMVDLVEQQTLSQIIRRNTRIGAELQENVFVLPGN